MEEALSMPGSVPAYHPFKYPPDFQLARYHQRCSMPGKPDLSLPVCPCCKQHPKVPFSNWWQRSIQKDFKDFGGAIVSYFWLLKLYILAITVIMCIYGFYLQYLTQHYCNLLEDPVHKLQSCSNLFGLWIISNGDLRDLMIAAGHTDVLVRFTTLRGMAFLVLLATGIAALYIIRWFNVRYPDKIGISSFSLLFKNLPTPNLEDLITQLRTEFGEFEIKEAFIIKKIEPFYTAYQQKLNKYYEYKIEPNQKKKLKLQREAEKLEKICVQHEDEYHQSCCRAIIIFYSREIRDEIYKKYKISRFQNLKLFFNNQYSQSGKIYCEECPKPSEMLWNNLGKEEKEGFHVKVKSIVYFFAVLAAFYLLLYFALQTIYIDELKQPAKTFIQFAIMFIITALALAFRLIMDRLSELRFPNTYTQRSMFIVMTTVSFHYLFYLFIPAIYQAVEVDRRGDVLKCISTQTLSFSLFQTIFCSIDIIYFLWNRGRKRVEDEEHPIGCQKILHSKIQYPRFPIEFKMIVLFKFWSLMTYFSFHTPIVLMVILAVLVFHYVKDKKNLYQHFRMEVINNQLQLNFLRFYTNVFVVFMFVIFIATQHEPIEYVISSIVVIAFIIFQNIYFRKNAKKQNDEEAHDIAKTLDDLDPASNVSYQEKYNYFLQISRNDKVDKTIKEELYGAGFSTINSEDVDITAKFLN